MTGRRGQAEAGPGQGRLDRDAASQPGAGGRALSTTPRPSAKRSPVTSDRYPARNSTTSGSAPSHRRHQSASPSSNAVLRSRHSPRRRDGRAHVVSVDGIWLDDAWWYGGSPGTLHQRNLEHDRRVVVHLEDTMAAVILEGSMERVVPPAEQAGRLKAASKAKYGYGPPEAAYAAGLWGLCPERARAWSAFPTDVTRFRFG